MRKRPRLELRQTHLQKEAWVDPISNPKSKLKLLSAVEHLRKVLSGWSDGILHVECLVDRLGVDCDKFLNASSELFQELSRSAFSLLSKLEEFFS
jgi:hypothetical protein